MIAILIARAKGKSAYRWKYWTMFSQSSYALMTRFSSWRMVLIRSIVVWNFCNVHLRIYQCLKFNVLFCYAKNNESDFSKNSTSYVYLSLYYLLIVVSTCHGKISKRGMDYWIGSKKCLSSWNWWHLSIKGKVDLIH